MSALTPDAQRVACPRCGSVSAASELGADRRCPSCARILPPSALEGIALAQPPRRATRELRAATAPAVERPQPAARNEVRPGRGEELEPPLEAIEGEATVVKPAPKAPTPRPPPSSEPEAFGDEPGERTVVTMAPASPEETRTQPAAAPRTRTRELAAAQVPAQDLPPGRKATRELAAAQVPPSELPPARKSTKELAAVQVPASELPPARRSTKELAAVQVPASELPPSRKSAREPAPTQVPAAEPPPARKSTREPAPTQVPPSDPPSARRSTKDLAAVQLPASELAPARKSTREPAAPQAPATELPPGRRPTNELAAAQVAPTDIRPAASTGNSGARKKLADTFVPATARMRKGGSGEAAAREPLPPPVPDPIESIAEPTDQLGFSPPPLPDAPALADAADEPTDHASATPQLGLPALEPAPVEARADDDLKEETVLGGYKLLKRIGNGGMGAVWLARQLSLDRNVALKVLHGDMSVDPHFVVRFNREAMAAGQLVHHNIVQIHDTGADRGRHFFSMEFVEGETLGSIIAREGKLDAEVAAGYVLQAARGLHYAHQHGMVHRDVKPENILLNRHGVVKIADLGLVKLRGVLRARDAAEHTVQADVTLGTPAYIAPEQVMDPAGVDHRADIYSLGCTFYELLTGRIPFEAETATDMLTKHVYDAPVPAQELVKRVPPALAATLAKMMAKAPDKRQASMADVVKELESYLGVDGSAAFSPREEHADQLERCVQTFNASVWNRRRGFALLGVLGAFAIALGVLGFLKLWLWMGLVGGGAVIFWFTAFVLRGLTQKTALFIRFRQHVLGARVLVWFLELASAVGAGFAIHTYRLHWHAGGTLGIGIALGVLWYFLLDRRVAKERRVPVEEIERMLRSIRLRGLDELALRQFVCKYSGDRWEPFYEQLFGYDAMLFAREKWGRNDRDLQRQRHATWRDPLIRFMDHRQRLRQERKSQRLLRKLEKRKQKAERKAEEDARRATSTSA